MKRLLFVILLVICFHAIGAEAANWYVRPSGGSGSGTSWTAAWNGLGAINWSSVSCGDTIWIAGGTYSESLSPSKNCTSGSPLYIRRARNDSSACTGSPGWSSGYDSTVIQSNSSIQFNAGTNNYITISGRTTASGGGYGWKVDHPDTSSDALGIVMWSGATVNHLTVEYMELAGPARAVYVSEAWGARGINDVPYNSSSSYHTFSHMSIHGWNDGIFSVAGVNYNLYEYIDMYDIGAHGGDSHPNLMYIHDSHYGTIRYSKFHNSSASGTGVAFSDLDTGTGTNYWKVYGNLFYDMTGGSGTAIAIQHGSVTGMKIFNNTFSNVDLNIRVGNSGGSCDSTSETRNNIFNGGTADTCGTASNSLTTSSSGIFTNYAAKDFHIVSTTGTGYPRNAGTNLSSYFTTDMDGTTLWCIGYRCICLWR